MGAGNDTFVWNPGDGSDIVEGQDGSDAMIFNGANIAEQVDVSANAGRVRFFRNVANITMDLDDVERIDFTARGGADAITVGDLSGTDLTLLNLDLAGTPGTNTGDGEPDSVFVTGTNGDDAIVVDDTSTGVKVTGLQARVNLIAPEGANDSLTISALGGNDTVDASSLPAGRVKLVENGGLGIDVLIGSAGGDVFNGGDGDDVVFMGAGDDTAVWNPGDDNDTFEGQSGFDTMLFNGANIAEEIDIAADGGRVRFTRNVASVVMDLNDVEGIDFTARGGADLITVGDLSGTDVTEVNLDLAVVGGAGDALPDTVVVSGTNSDDVILVTGDANGTSVLGLAARVNITGAEAANDRLVVHAQAGDDVVEASGLAVGAIQLTADGGDGADILVGGAGDDLVVGDVGRDFLIGGEGADKLVGDADDDILIGGTYAQAGRRPATSAILAEWTSGRTYQQRVDNLRDGSGTATRFNQLRDQDNNLLEDFFLSNDRLFKTVYDDFAPDRLTGNAGEDWFFANVDGPVVDKITDLLSSEFSDADRNFVNEL